MSDTASKTPWHRFVGKLLELLLIPLGIRVAVEQPIMSEPPKSDIILLRRDGDDWTAAQKAVLADGIRDCTAANILLELKYTQSINGDALQQTLGYEYFYRQSQNLKRSELGCFLISSRTPQAATLDAYGYEETDKSGVYRSNQAILRHIILISLNDLANTPHNAWLKVFASKQAEKHKAFKCLRGFTFSQPALESFTETLLKLLLTEKGERLVETGMTPEDVEELVTLLEDPDLGALYVKMKLRALTPEERLEGLEPEERLKGLDPESVVSLYDPEERLKGLDPESVVSLYDPEELLKGLEPAERLKGLEPEIIEAYLAQLKRDAQH